MIIESSVIEATFVVETPGPPPLPGSLDICFCNDLHEGVCWSELTSGQLVELPRASCLSA